MQDNQEKVQAAAEYLRRRVDPFPKVAVLTGTGLGGLAGALAMPQTFKYTDIPHFPDSTAPGHAGSLAIGMVGDRKVAVFQGRLHLYEGYSPFKVTFPIRVMAALEVERVVLTNASGGLNPAFEAGQLMLIRDHINLTGQNPLIGPNVDRWGPRFPDMTAAYDRALAKIAVETARQAGVVLHTGIYVGLRGPSLETPAEMRFLRLIGADAVGFSTVLETIAAVHAGIKVTGLSIITNMADPDHPRPADLESIIAVARKAAPDLSRLLAGVLERL